MADPHDRADRFELIAVCEGATLARCADAVLEDDPQPAEVELDGTRGFAMVPGKAERAALSGAILDAAVAAGHEETPSIAAALEDAAARQREQRQRAWSESKHTAVEFESMEGRQ
jgi:alpha-D-ribose 1-methylphosphonate 5-triphosphate synthase subunit PhnG